MPKRRTINTFALAPLALGLALASGCADQPTMLQITGAGVLNSDCASTNDTLSLAAGVVDVSLASGYLLTPKIRNVAPGSETVGTAATAGGGGGGAGGGGFQNLDLEGNSIMITGAKVDFDPGDLDGSGIDLAGFDVPIAGTIIDPGVSDGWIQIYVLNQFHMAQMASVLAPGQTALIIVELTLTGMTTSETDVESNVLSYPITVCNGCLAPVDCEATPASSGATERCALIGQDVAQCAVVEDTTMTDPMTTP